MRSNKFLLLSTLILSIAVKTVAEEKKNENDYEKDEADYGQKPNAASLFGMEYVPIGHLRTDPILSQDCLSDHVHTFYGPPLVHPSVTFEELRSTRNTREATSGNVLENQSLYWHPSFYKQSGDGTKEIVEPDWTTIYYAYQKGETKSFPEGFRMLSTLPGGLKLTCQDNLKETYKEKSDEGDYDGIHFPSEPCKELAASFTFPNCWDGKTLGTEGNPRSHVAYGIGLEQMTVETFGYGNVQCPESHPVLLPQIMLFLRFADYTGEPHELSNGDGVDWHADYIMGWDKDFLQGILDDCDGLKDIPCGSTRLRDIDSKSKSINSPTQSYSKMGEALRKVRVPMVNTTCITEEPITNIESPPRGACQGDVISVDSCKQPEFPAEFLVNTGKESASGGSALLGTATTLTFAMLVAVFFTTTL